MRSILKSYESMMKNAPFFSQKEVISAWESFLTLNGNIKSPSVRSLVHDSWSRSLSQGVNPDLSAAPLFANEGQLYRTKYQNIDLIQSSRPIFEQANVYLKGLGAVLFLTDHHGLNLDVSGDPKTIHRVKEIGLVAGSIWSEKETGSNAVGTAIVTGLPTQVHGEEHFCSGFKPWTCTATPVFDPFDKQLIGVIDITGLLNVFDRIHIPLVVSWASQIQERIRSNTLKKWEQIKVVSNFNSKSKFLLYDNQGRLINSEGHEALSCAELKKDFSPKSRVSFLHFGAEEIIYPHDDGCWLREERVQPIKLKGEILGYAVYLQPGSNRQYFSRAHRPQKESTTPKVTSNNIVIGESRSTQQTLLKARKSARTPLPILLLGETGVGKEIYAKEIHAKSTYSDGPFIDLNCGALSKELLNSELFGHVEGAFTGSKKGGMVGKIQAANGGTLFLDEIGELPIEIQPVLLRVLQDKIIYRVGDIQPIPVDFRLVAATNVDLNKAVLNGTFRKDLFYRLSTIKIKIDPLSRRLDDIGSIVLLTINKVKSKQEIIPEEASLDLINELKQKDWPGNVRELINTIEYMCYMSENKVLTVLDLPEEYRSTSLNGNLVKNEINSEGKGNVGSLDSSEKKAIEQAISVSNGNITLASKKLGIAKSTLYLKIKKYNIITH